MGYVDNFPSNQRNSGATPNPLAPPPSPPTGAQSPPLARIQPKAIDGTAIGDNFRKVGNDIVKQQLPGFFHRLLHSLVDAIFPGSLTMPYVGRSNYAGMFGGYTGGYYGARMSQMPQYGQRAATGYAGQPMMEEPLARFRTFDTFMLPDKLVAMDVFQGLISDAIQTGYLTVSQVYDRLRLPCSYMGVRYYWTADDLRNAEISETATGECRVKMPKAKLMN